MLKIISFVRYSNSSIRLDSNFLICSIIFFLVCGILILQNRIWEEEDFLRNKKWLKWKSLAIRANKADLSNIYPVTKNKTPNS